MAEAQQHGEALLVDRLCAGLSGGAAEDRRGLWSELSVRQSFGTYRETDLKCRQGQWIRARLRAREVLFGSGEQLDPDRQRGPDLPAAISRQGPLRHPGTDRSRSYAGRANGAISRRSEASQ